MPKDQRFRSNANAHGLNFGEIVILQVDKDGTPVDPVWAQNVADGFLQVVPDPVVPAPIEDEAPDAKKGVLANSHLREVPPAKDDAKDADKK